MGVLTAAFYFPDTWLASGLLYASILTNHQYYFLIICYSICYSDGDSFGGTGSSPADPECTIAAG